MKNIGNIVALYPTPVVIVGVKVNGKVNFINIAHIGIVALDSIMLSMHKSHHSNIGMKENMKCSVNIMSVDDIAAVDYVGIVSGKKFDKSNIFDYEISDGVPIITTAKISMQCSITDIYETESHEQFILKVENTFVDEKVMNKDGKIDYLKVNPLLFEMQNRQYLSLGKVEGKCWNIGKDYAKL